MDERPETKLDPVELLRGPGGRCLVGPDGRVRDANDSWFSTTLLTREQVLGLDVLGLFPDSRSLFTAVYERVRAGHEILVPMHAERVAHRAVWWAGRVSPVPMADGAGAMIVISEWVEGAGYGLPPPAGRVTVEDPKILERYRALLETSAEIVCWTNERGEATSLAPAWIEFTGQTIEEGRGYGWLTAIHPEDLPGTVAAWRAAREAGANCEVEYRLRRYDGAWRRVVARSVPVHDEDGHHRGHVSTISDVTDRREAEEALREAARKSEQNRAQLEAILQAMREGVLVIDDGGEVVFANDAEARMFKLERANELMDKVTSAPGLSEGEGRRGGLGRLIEILSADGSPLPADRMPSRRTMRGESIVNELYLVRNRETGTIRTFRFNTAPIRDEQGAPALALILSQDVTKAKEAEDALRESEERFRTLADNIAQLVWIADENAKAVWCNRRWIEYTGVEVGAIGRLLSGEVIHPEHRERAIRNTELCISRGEPLDDVYPIRGKDGDHRWFLTRAVPIRDDRGRISRWFVSCTDITEQRRVEDELRDADRRKDEFLGVLSHELRNPLAPIRNSMFILDRSSPGSPQAARAKEVIERQTQHLSRMVDELLDVTRVTRGKIELNRVRMDLREVVRQTCEDHRSFFLHGEVLMRVDVPFDPIWVDADRTRIAQVVGKLLMNASKFTPSGGRVDVELQARSGRAEITVRDSGVGIEPAMMERLFTPFGQADRSLARTQGGLGLGLALTKGLVELHGGSVTARSEGAGKGAEFLVTLPLAPVQTPEVHVREAEGQDLDGVGRSVLIIEDNVDAGDSLAEALELSGHHVSLARDGQTGLAMARSIRPDVIVCDIGLPDIDGYHVARELRGDDGFRSTRLIALTGYARPEDKKRAREAGFDAHLPKPPPLDTLNALVAVQ